MDNPSSSLITKSSINTKNIQQNNVSNPTQLLIELIRTKRTCDKLFLQVNKGIRYDPEDTIENMIQMMNEVFQYMHSTIDEHAIYSNLDVLPPEFEETHKYILDIQEQIKETLQDTQDNLVSFEDPNIQLSCSSSKI